MTEDELRALEVRVEHAAARLLTELDALLTLASGLPRDRLEAIGEGLKDKIEAIDARMGSMFPVRDESEEER